MRLVDLSHAVEEGLETYPGLPPPRISMHLSRQASERHYARGTSFAITRIEMVANTGTYLDAPFHRFPGGKDIAGLALEAVANLPGICLDVSGRQIAPAILRGWDYRGKAVLLRTGWSRRFGTADYMRDYPFITREAAEYLVEAGVALVGTDSPNIDDDTDPERPAHTALLGAEIPVVEHLTALDLLPREGFHFFAVPPKIRGATSFSVRAFALLG